MSYKLWYLTKMSLGKKIKSKWFIAVNIFFLILTVFLLNIEGVITFFGGDFNKTQNIIVLDSTNQVSSTFSTFLTQSDDEQYKIKVSSKTEQEEREKLLKNDDDTILIIFEKDPDSYLKAKIISQEKINALSYQTLVEAIQQAKNQYALSFLNISEEELVKISLPVSIEREVLKESQSVDESMETIMGAVFPTLILPFFMLTIFLVQMIGADICEEKSTRSMEIIISNVSAKIHFASKVLAANLFVLLQGALLVLFTIVGMIIRNILSNGNAIGSLQVSLGSIWDSLVATGFIDKLWYFIPLLLILMIASFIAYSLLAGILASVTTNMEDFQQIQTPIMILCLIGYYLSITAGVFEGSLFIKIISYIPFISSLLSPALFALGQIGIVDILISIGMTILVIFIFIHYGMRIYKAGILNYSSEKVWTRFLKVIKNKDI